MGEDLCKWSAHQGINLLNTYISHWAFYQNNKKPQQWTKDLNRWFSKEDRHVEKKKTWKDAQRHWLLKKYNSKLQWHITSHQSEWLSFKSLQTINDGESAEKREPSCTAGGNVSWCSHYREQYGSYFKNNSRIAVWSRNPTPGNLNRENHNSKDTCTPIFIAPLFKITKTWKQLKCPSTDEWIKMMQYTYTMEYYSAIKKNKIMLFAATRMELETHIK